MTGNGKLCRYLPLAKEGADMASMNVSIPDRMRDWVQHRIESGQYATVSDYVRDLIRRDQVQADEHNALIAALIEGERRREYARRYWLR